MKKINFKKIKDLLKVLLVCFTLISVGYMLGKNATESRDSESEISSTDNYVAVYYLHSTFRCETCNQIEAMTRDLLEREYRAAMENGDIHWREIDFMKNTAMAKQFDVAASCVVVARIRNGHIDDYQRLDDVWTLLNDRAAFDNYIRIAIETYLNAEEIS
jgi:hypothetical protein